MLGWPKNFFATKCVMSFMAIILILTFSSCIKSNDTHYKFSDCLLNQCASNSNVPLNYPRKSLKCYACINNSDGVKQQCSRKAKFITCKYSTELQNWLDVDYTKSMSFGCLLLIYKGRQYYINVSKYLTNLIFRKWEYSS